MQSGFRIGSVNTNVLHGTSVHSDTQLVFFGTAAKDLSQVHVASACISQLIPLRLLLVRVLFSLQNGASLTQPLADCQGGNKMFACRVLLGRTTKTGKLTTATSLPDVYA